MMFDSNQSSWFYHVIYIMISQIWYVFYWSSTLQAPVGSAQDPGIWCGCSATFKFQFCQMESDWWGTWEYPRYQYFKVLKWYLEYFSFLTKGRYRHFMKILKIVVYIYIDTWPMSMSSSIVQNMVIITWCSCSSIAFSCGFLKLLGLRLFSNYSHRASKWSWNSLPLS